MRFSLSVLIGAASYGVLSTIVVLAYGEGFQLGEVVGAQLLTGFVLSWLLVLVVYGMRKRRGSGAAQLPEAGGSSVPAFRLVWKQRALLMAAGVPTVATGLLYYQSLRYVPASLAIILLFQFTWMSVLIQAIGRRQRPSVLIVVALLVLLGGTALASGAFEHDLGRFPLLGVAFGLLAAVSYSLFLLLSGKVVPQAHPVYRSAWMVTGGFLFLCVLFPPHFLWNGLLFGPLLLFGALLGLFGAFLPPLLFAYGVPHIGEGMAAIIGAVELPVAVLLSAIVLHEQVSGWQWFGVLLILAGVALPELYGRSIRRQPAPRDAA